MTRAWTVLLISALIDGSIAAITGVMTILTVPLLAKDGAVVPWSAGLLVVPVLGGALIFAKTIQSALGQTSTMIAELRGKPVITTTTLPASGAGEVPVIITKAPDRTVIEQHLARRSTDPPLWPPPPLPPQPPAAVQPPPGLSEAQRTEIDAYIDARLAPPAEPAKPSRRSAPC